MVQNLTQRGDAVFCLDRSPPDFDCAHYVKVDVSSNASVQGAFDQIGATTKTPIRAMIYCAGVLQPRSFLDLTEDEFQHHLDVNLLGAFRVGQASARAMMACGGAMVFVTSIHGQIGVPDRCAYAASKGGVASMVRVMASELSASGIRVNALAPGAVDGGLAGHSGTRHQWAEAVPSKRVAQLDEVAQAAAMLASNDASFINGQVISIDGGTSTVRLISGVDALAQG